MRRCTVLIAVLLAVCSCGRRQAGLDVYHEALALADRGDAPAALKTLQRAGELARTDSLRALVYSQMGTLYFGQRLLDRSLESYRRAYAVDLRARDTLGLIYDLRDIGNVLRATEDGQDSCIACFEEARRLAIAVGNEPMQHDVESQMAGYYLYHNQLEEARLLLFPALQHIGAENQSGLLFMAADYYHRSGQRDSAVCYYRQLLAQGNIFTRQAAHRALAEYCMADGLTDEAMEHLRQYESLTDSVHKQNDAEGMRRTAALYDYSLREQQAATLHGRLVMAVASVLLLVALLVVVVLYYSRRRMHYRLKVERLEQLLERYRSRQTDVRLKTDVRMDGTAESRNPEITESRNDRTSESRNDRTSESRNDRTSESRNDDITEFRENEQASETEPPQFSNTTIAKTIDRFLSDAHPQAMGDDDFHQLEDAIEACHPAFLRRLQEFCRLTPQERRVCLLLKAGVAPAGIAQLTAHTKQSVTNTRSRLYIKTFGRSGAPAEWDEFIQSL